MPFRKIIVTVVGGTILVFGLALLVLPGPAFVVIPIGLAVLATEFVWARRWLRRAKGMVNQRKARRTTRAVWVTCRRKWDRLHIRLLRRFRPGTPGPVLRPKTAKEGTATMPVGVPAGIDGASTEPPAPQDSAPCLTGSPASPSTSPTPVPPGPR